MAMTKRRSLYFNSPRQVEVREETLPDINPDEVLVETLCSAISPGTEMLVYRGEFPDIPADTHIESLSKSFSYPLNYGYACVGRIKETGKQVNKDWENRLVFSFHPHDSHFLAKPNSLLVVPENVEPETAAFLCLLPRTGPGMGSQAANRGYMRPIEGLGCPGSKKPIYF